MLRLTDAPALVAAVDAGSPALALVAPAAAMSASWPTPHSALVIVAAASCAVVDDTTSLATVSQSDPDRGCSVPSETNESDQPDGVPDAAPPNRPATIHSDACASVVPPVTAAAVPAVVTPAARVPAVSTGDVFTIPEQPIAPRTRVVLFVPVDANVNVIVSVPETSAAVAGPDPPDPWAARGGGRL